MTIPTPVRIPKRLLPVHYRVPIGAAWLDEHYPDWAFEINQRTLAMASPNECILGQLAHVIAGGAANFYSLVVNRGDAQGGAHPDNVHTCTEALRLVTRLEIDEADCLGFDIGVVPPDSDFDMEERNDENYRALEAAWRAQISKRVRA